MALTQITHRQEQPPTPSFQQAAEFAKATVAPSSAATYQRTFTLWQLWCAENRVLPVDLRPLIVRAFLSDQPVTRRTRQRHLAALRKLARVLALDPSFPQYKTLYDALRLLKIPEDNLGGQERQRRALEPDAIWTLVNVWSGDRLLHRRNRAMIALLFYTGLRRSELAALHWRDVDFVSGTIEVTHGKGDKRRTVAVVEGPGDPAINALRAYQQALFALNGTREAIFCSINKADKPGADRPMNARAINQIVDKTAAQAGITFTPHDARRTLGTHLLASDNPTADVQAQLGHAHASTTIQEYAMPADAKKRRSRFKTGY